MKQKFSIKNSEALKGYQYQLCNQTINQQQLHFKKQNKTNKIYVIFYFIFRYYNEKIILSNQVLLAQRA